jgi:hypothetical protein
LADDSEEVEMERAKDREIELLRQLEEQENGDHDVVRVLHLPFVDI